jgi:phosphoribosylformylglycinamidine synthase subunit PurL
MSTVTGAASSVLEELASDVGLAGPEIDEIVTRLGRTPNRVELAVFAGMWSEHCSYKSTRRLLATLPTDGDRVLAGPGAHAGTVDVGGGWAVAFKVESHNHPSAVEPYQGALTGVGGILRDVVAQGARPVAVMDALCFGDPQSPRTRYLEDGIVAGVGGYGNAYGVPNVGGVTRYDARYDGNPLVNALAAGMVRHDAMRTAAASEPGNALLIVGATTGRDGILGAAFASEELGDEDEHRSSRSHVQVGDPFMGKKLMEAVLSFTPADGLVAGQDLGACGIACAVSEMAAAGEVGFDVDLGAVPLREEDMGAAEILLSESQERFMLVVASGRAKEAIAHFEAHGVAAAVCGQVTDTGRMRVTLGGDTVVDLPAGLVADGTPEATWPTAASLPAPEPYEEIAPPDDAGVVLLELLSEPGVRDMAPLYSQYDQTVGNRTMRGPGAGEAAVLKIPGSKGAFALTLVADGPGCAVDPYVGAQALLGEAIRNLACAGAEAVAITDGINVGSPSDPVEYLRLSEMIRGLGDGLRSLGIAVTGGNCSLYNESPSGAVPPTLVIGAIGVIGDRRLVPGATMTEGEVVLLLGDLGAGATFSTYGRLRTGRHSGPAPYADLGADRRLAGLLVAQCAAGRVGAAKDAGRGGAATALAKLCVRSGVGADVDLDLGERPDWALFGEGPGVAWVTVAPGDVEAVVRDADAAGVTCRAVGTVGGDRLRVADVVDVTLDDLRTAYSGLSRPPMPDVGVQIVDPGSPTGGAA